MLCGGGEAVIEAAPLMPANLGGGVSVAPPQLLGKVVR